MNSFGRLLAGLLGLALVGGAVVVARRALTGERESRPAQRRPQPLPVQRAVAVVEAPGLQAAGEAPEQAEKRSFLFDRWPRFACRHPWFVIGGALLLVIDLWGAVVDDAGRVRYGRLHAPGRGVASTHRPARRALPQGCGRHRRDRDPRPGGSADDRRSGRGRGAARPGQGPATGGGGDFPLRRSRAASRRTAPSRASRRSTKQAPTKSTKASITALFDWRKDASREELQVELGGIVATAGEREAPGSAELVGLAAAAVILLIAFGSVTAAGLPILTALLALIPAFFLIGIGASFVNFADFTPQFAAMIGIGVGIDYALLIVTRFREALARGMTVPDAVAKAASTAGHSVLFAGCSVVIALMGLWAIGVPLLSLTAMGPALAVALAAIVALFVLPAILGLVGHRIERFRLPGMRVAAIQDEAGMGYRLSRLIQRAPWLWLIVATAGMLVLAYPALDVRLGASDAGSNPTSLSSRRSYDLLAEGFGVGFNGPIVVGAAFESDDQANAFETLPPQLANLENVVNGHAGRAERRPVGRDDHLVPGQLPPGGSDGRTRPPSARPATASARGDGRRRVGRRRDGGLHRHWRPRGVTHGALPERRHRGELPAADGRVPLAAGSGEGGADERAGGGGGVRHPRRDLPVGLGRGPAWAGRHGPDRVVPADDDVRGAVRPLDGLRGVPREPRAGGVPGDGRQRRGGGARPLRHESRHLGGGGDHGGGIPQLLRSATSA